MVACSVENNVPMDSTRIWIKETGITGTYPDLKRFTVPYHCMHCKDPSCVSACTVSALARNENGIVTYDQDICIGCRYCMYACPFKVPNYEWDERFPLVVKCDMCFPGWKKVRCRHVRRPVQRSDILFGPYEDMLTLAHRAHHRTPGQVRPARLWRRRKRWHALHCIFHLFRLRNLVSRWRTQHRRRIPTGLVTKGTRRSRVRCWSACRVCT